MVHLEDAEPTLFAVMGADWLPGLFACALSAVLNVHEFALERCFHSFRHASRVSKSSSEVGSNGHNTKTVKNEGVDNSFPSERNSLNHLLVEYVSVVPIENTEAISTEPTVHH